MWNSINEMFQVWSTALSGTAAHAELQELEPTVTRQPAWWLPSNLAPAVRQYTGAELHIYLINNVNVFYFSIVEEKISLFCICFCKNSTCLFDFLLNYILLCIVFLLHLLFRALKAVSISHRPPWHHSLSQLPVSLEHLNRNASSNSIWKMSASLSSSRTKSSWRSCSATASFSSHWNEVHSFNTIPLLLQGHLSLI